MSDDSDKLDEVANDLDELKTAVDELAQRRGDRLDSGALGSLRDALEQASDAADQLEDDSAEERSD
jgi:hypothetical protein